MSLWESELKWTKNELITATARPHTHLTKKGYCVISTPQSTCEAGHDNTGRVTYEIPVRPLNLTRQSTTNK